MKAAEREHVQAQRLRGHRPAVVRVKQRETRRRARSKARSVAARRTGGNARDRAGPAARTRCRARTAPASAARSVATPCAAGRDRAGAGKDKPEREADRAEERRKDEVGRREAMPRRVIERPPDVIAGARIVDEDHPRDRQPAKDVEPGQPRLTGGGRGGVHVTASSTAARSSAMPMPPSLEVAMISGWAAGRLRASSAVAWVTAASSLALTLSALVRTMR